MSTCGVLIVRFESQYRWVLQLNRTTAAVSEGKIRRNPHFNQLSFSHSLIIKLFL